MRRAPVYLLLRTCFAWVRRSLDCVGNVVRVVRRRAVLAAVLVAVDVAVLVHVLRAQDGLAGRVAVDVAVAGAVLVAVDAVMGVAMLACMLVTVVVMFVTVVVRFRHLSPPDNSPFETHR